MLCHIGIGELDGNRNIDKYINNKAQFERGDENYYQTNDGHWNIEGHHEVAKLIEDFIKKKYKN